MNVLISSAGRRVSLAREFKTELARLAPGGLVIATDLRPELSAACQVVDRSFTAPPVTDPSYIEHMLHICSTEAVTLLVPTIDTELLVLAQNRDRFAAIGTDVSVSDLEFVRRCRDKRLTADLFEARGIRTPALMAKGDLRFPLFAKPYDGSLSKDACVIHSPEDLAPHHLANEKLLFMEYIDPRLHDEFTVDMLYDHDHNLVCAVPRLRLEVRGGEISKGRTVKGPLLSQLRDRLKVLDGARGCVTAQFFVHRESHEAVGIEINPRFGGGYPLSYRAGANYPAWLIEHRMGHAPRAYADEWEDGLLMLRYDDEIIVHDPGRR